ncbi:MAG: aldo/keto reductase [Caldilineaceae bacterium]
MQSKILGRTGLELSIVGLGTAFSGMRTIKEAQASYEALVSGIDEELGVQTVQAAIESGCTLIDTAALYGGGKAEEIIGHALAERPDLAQRCIVTTKTGRMIHGYDYSYDGVMREVEASLRRLRFSQLPVVYIHDPMGVPMEEVMGKDRALGALRKLQDQGVVRFIGTAADDPRVNVRYIETGEFDAAVVPRAWSLINQFALRGILPAAIKHNVGLVIATSLERGLLATGPQPDTVYYDRNYSPECQAHVGKIQQLCQAHHVPLLAVALQWVTRHPQVTTTIPGARFPDEARANAEAATVAIPESFWGELEPLLRHFDDASNF